MEYPQIKIQVSIEGQSSTVQIRSSQDAASIFRKVFNADTLNWVEESVMLCLNRKYDLIGYYKISSGGMSGTVVDPKVIYTIALQSGAHSIILAHNHPSGNTTPSSADITITRQLRKAGELLDIKLFDHIILTADSHYSMVDNGDL